ncbi:MAG: 16S rRNA (guanine(527)-N(7))-methyltransferase RsmG [Alphaproteobacteria bacterium]
MTPETFRAAAGVSRETTARLAAYAALLGRWQRRINLVGAATLADVWRRHMLDSAQLRPYVPRACRRLVDLGSGAGFPGLVLAILGVEGVELVESDGRKCAFLAEAARETGARVVIHHQRIEAMPSIPADVITARACAPLPKLLDYAAQFLTCETSCLFLKGARVDEELTQAAKKWKMRVAGFPSRTDPSGVVLHIQGISRDPQR